jgi:hypothetical protein
MLCINDSAWFLKAFVVSPIFVVESWRHFFAGFVVGFTHEDLVPLFLVTLPLQTLGNLSNLVDFGGARVVEVEP